jgi:MFS family permease
MPKPSSYRWIILTVLVLITISIEIQWLTHASVARPAEVFYKGQFVRSSFLNIDFLAMIYMIMFIIFSFPASYLIDKYGISKTLTIAAIMLGFFSLSKAFFASNFAGVVISQIGLAIAQPVILNSVTSLTAKWFPLEERGLAAGLASLAQYIGIIIAMVVTPLLIVSNAELPEYGNGFEQMLWIYAIVSLIAALALIVLMKEFPNGNAYGNKVQKQSFSAGVFHILRNRDMKILLFLFFIGLGIFNAISSMTDSLAEHSGVKDSDGLIGGLMLIGGILGAFILPMLSDKFRKRKLFLIICIAGMIPGIFGMAFSGMISSVPETTYNLLLFSSFIIGFFMMSAGPIGFQYAAEVCFPAPESASQGMLLWIGQLSGMLFVAGMSMNNNQYISELMYAFAALAIISFVVILFIRESPMFSVKK